MRSPVFDWEGVSRTLNFILSIPFLVAFMIYILIVMGLDWLLGSNK